MNMSGKMMRMCRVHGRWGAYTDERMDDVKGLERYECLDLGLGEDLVEEIRRHAPEGFSGTLFTKKPLWGCAGDEPDGVRYPGFASGVPETEFNGLGLTLAQFVLMDDGALDRYARSGDIRAAWPKDGLLCDMADEYSCLLEKHWDFSRCGGEDPWVFRVAVQDALRVTDDGDVLLDPQLLVESFESMTGCNS